MDPNPNTDDMGLSYDYENATAFRINDPVRILWGDAIGETGSVVSLIGRNPQPMYLVETCGGRDLLVRECDLMLLGDGPDGFDPQARR